VDLLGGDAMKKYLFTHYYVRHLFIEESKRPFKGNLMSGDSFGDLFFVKYNWFKGEVKGGGRGCSDSSKGARQMYGDFKLYFLGPFFVSLGQWYGWVAKHPEMGFTNNEYGIMLFGHMFTISQAFNFAPTSTGKRKFGIQLQWKKVKPYKGLTKVEDVEHPLIGRTIVDPHLKGKFK